MQKNSYWRNSQFVVLIKCYWHVNIWEVYVDKNYNLSRIAEVRNSFRILVDATDNLQDLGDEKSKIK
jgi:hypothetical protein